MRREIREVIYSVPDLPTYMDRNDSGEPLEFMLEQDAGDMWFMYKGLPSFGISICGREVTSHYSDPNITAECPKKWPKRIQRSATFKGKGWQRRMTDHLNAEIVRWRAGLG